MLHSFTNRLKCDKVIFLGDYNLPRISWFSDPLHYLPLALVQNYSMFDLIQHFTPLPTEGYSLDLLFAVQSFVTISDTPFDLLKIDNHHVSLLAD